MWTERRPGLGEDADPLMFFHRPTQTGLLAVFDGAGGAGSAPAWRSASGTERTGAWTGARSARLATELWFHDRIVSGEHPSCETLEDELRRVLVAAVPAARSKVVGTMRRQLPTTIAAVHYRYEGSGLVAEAMWAGDSRAYVLTPNQGLQVLTRDHTEETDALEQLVQDPPMTNMICADRPFHVESSHHRLSTPGIYLCSTDGFFGYVNTPGDFEYLLLSHLERAPDMSRWAHDLAETVRGYSADDASLVLAAVGFKTFDALREAFAPRLEQAESRYREMPPLEDQDAMRDWRLAQWNAYRETYETLLPELRQEDE
ncbi:serine/threonine protein phosphatase [Streptacidiphilus sp. MAP5-3]|uniref:serine/threonine protein phosphatase n=1 Tax=unclassified Streptacidiphilus TaxID=2643834 RepID=UPI003518A5C2